MSRVADFCVCEPCRFTRLGRRRNSDTDTEAPLAVGFHPGAPIIMVTYFEPGQRWARAFGRLHFHRLLLRAQVVSHGDFIRALHPISRISGF